MKIYLDLCSLQRPLDNKNQIRIMLEAESVLAILALIDSGEIELVSSEVLAYEASRNPDISRKEYSFDVLLKAKIFIKIDEKIQNRAKEFTLNGIKPLDSLHLASAEYSRANYFCTSDIKFIKNAKSINNLGIQIVTPIELVGEIELWKSK